MNTQNKKPYFRKFEDGDWDLYMGCEENPIIAEFKDYPIDGGLYDIHIVIDTWTNLNNAKQERLGFHLYSKSTTHRCYVCMSELEVQSRKTLKQIAREIMEVSYLSIVTFEANKFQVIEN